MGAFCCLPGLRYCGRMAGSGDMLVKSAVRGLSYGLASGVFPPRSIRFSSRTLRTRSGEVLRDRAGNVLLVRVRT